VRKDLPERSRYTAGFISSSEAKSIHSFSKLGFPFNSQDTDYKATGMDY
jgi:hypothetical protein